MKDKELMYHLIDWGIALVLGVIPLLKRNYLLVLLIIVSAFCVSLFLFVQKVKRRLDVYERLLKYPIPLYGIINYIAKQKVSKSSYQNEGVHLKQITLAVGLKGNILENKNNDLGYSWSFEGINCSNKNLGRFYLRIGGDSAVDFDNLGVECIDCSAEMGECTFSTKMSECSQMENCLEKRNAYFIKNEVENSRTLYILDIKFIERKRMYDELKLKVMYTWPQCFNCKYDFLLIDPGNFAEKVDKIRVSVVVDKIIIKSDSMVQLFSINNENSAIENEGRIFFEHKSDSFEREWDVEPRKIYFITIEN